MGNFQGYGDGGIKISAVSNVKSFTSNNFKGFRHNTFNNPLSASNLLEVTDDLEVEVLIQQLSDGILTMSMISEDDKLKIYGYMQRNNSLIGRILDLHTNIPLSSFALKRPADDTLPSLAKDYVYNWYKKLLSDLDFQKFLQKLILHYWTYGSAYALAEDYVKEVTDDDREGVSEIELHKRLSEAEENIKIYYAQKNKNVPNINNIDKIYLSKPGDVSSEHRKNVLEIIFPLLDREYKGLQRIRVLQPITEYVNVLRNDMINYVQVNYKMPKGFQQALDTCSDKVSNRHDANSVHDLMEKIGYTKAFLNFAADYNYMADVQDKILANDYYNSPCYLLEFRKNSLTQEGHASLLQRVIEPAIAYIVAQRRSREKAVNSLKKTFVVTGSDETNTPEILEEIADKIQESSHNPEGTVISATSDVTIQEITTDNMDKADLEGIIQRVVSEITSALGIPDSLLSGEQTTTGSAYGVNFLKVDMLVTEYAEFRQAILRFLVDNVFKPISIKKGFVVKDVWGDVKVITPLVSFDRQSVTRGTDDFQFLEQLVTQGMLPKSVLLRALGYDPDEIAEMLKQETISTLNSDMMNGLSSAITEIAQSLKDDPVLKEKIGTILGYDVVSTENNNKGGIQ